MYPLFVIRNEQRKMSKEEYTKQVIEMYEEAKAIKSYPERLLRIAFCLILLEDKKLLDELSKDASSTKRVIGCGRKMDALGYVICGEFDDLKHGGKQWLCEDCEKLNKSEINSHQQKETSQENVIGSNVGKVRNSLNRDKEVSNKTDDIHSQNKDLLDGDYK